MRILHATDGSEGALEGARLLACLPLRQEDHVTLLTVLPEEAPEAEPAAVLTPARETLSRTAAALDTEISRERRGSGAAEEILRVAEADAADLVVVGSRGLSGLSRFFLGSVSERVARHADRPVLLARPLRGGLRGVVLGVDGSEGAARATGWLEQLPLPEETELHLVTVLLPRYAAVNAGDMAWPSLTAELEKLYDLEAQAAQKRLDALVSALTLNEKRVTAHVETGDPALSLLEAAERHQADLLVVGSHGLTGVDRFLLGSVSEKVLRHAECSVLVVK